MSYLFLDFDTILIGFILLLPVDFEQLFNGVIAPNWPLALQIIMLLQGWAINIGG